MLTGLGRQEHIPHLQIPRPEQIRLSLSLWIKNVYFLDYGTNFLHLASKETSDSPSLSHSQLAPTNPSSHWQMPQTRFPWLLHSGALYTIWIFICLEKCRGYNTSRSQSQSQMTWTFSFNTSSSPEGPMWITKSRCFTQNRASSVTSKTIFELQYIFKSINFEFELFKKIQS